MLAENQQLSCMRNGMISILPLSTSHIHVHVATSHYHLHVTYISLNSFDMQGPALHTNRVWEWVDYWQTSWCYRDFYSLVWCLFASSMAVTMIQFIITNFPWTICCLTFLIETVLVTQTLTADNSAFMIMELGSPRVWPVDRDAYSS
jgi:hypothetical protein